MQENAPLDYPRLQRHGWSLLLFWFVPLTATRSTLSAVGLWLRRLCLGRDIDRPPVVRLACRTTFNALDDDDGLG